MKVVNTGEATTLLGRISRAVRGTREDGAMAEVWRPRRERHYCPRSLWRNSPFGRRSLVGEAHRITAEASFIGLSPVCGGGKHATSCDHVTEALGGSQPNNDSHGTHYEVFLGWPRSFDQRRRDTMRAWGRARGSREEYEVWEGSGEYRRVKISGGTRFFERRPRRITQHITDGGWLVYCIRGWSEVGYLLEYEVARLVQATDIRFPY